MPKAILRPWGYTGQTRSAGVPLLMGRDSVNQDTHRGENYPSRGFIIERDVFDASGAQVFSGSWLHQHTDGTNRLWYYAGDKLFADDGTSTPPTLATGFGTPIVPVAVTMGPPAGQSIFFSGANSVAQLIRFYDPGGGVQLVADLFDYPAPTLATAVANTTGSLATGTYHVMITLVDRNGLAVPTAPQQILSIAVTGPNGSIDVSIAATPDPTGRSTDWKVYVSSTTTAPSSFLEESDLIFATKTKTIIALTGTQPIDHRAFAGSEFLQQATMPLVNVDRAWLFQGRLCIASSLSNEVFVSERGNPNLWYTINEVTAGSETGWSGYVQGGIEAHGVSIVFLGNAIHSFWGDLTRDTTTGFWDIHTRPITQNVGLVGPNAVTMIDSAPYFISARGLEVIGSTGVRRIPFPGRGTFARDLDLLSADRTVLANDPEGYVCILAPRLVNTTRAMDGASVAGSPDRIFRFDYKNGTWACPLALGDYNWISTRPDVVGGDPQGNPALFGMDYVAQSVRFGIGWSGGGPKDVSTTSFDGKLSSADTTTSVTVSDALLGAVTVGMTLELFYPLDDAVLGGVRVIKKIVGGTVGGGTLTLNWLGALPTPTGATKWTARIAGYANVHDLTIDLTAALGLPPGTKIQVISARARYRDVVGMESVG